jgi:hypothetical protein
VATGKSKLAKVLWFFLSRKNFFFEKKKQKTFATLSKPIHHKAGGGAD